MSHLLVENGQIEVGAVPIDTTGAACAGDYVSMKDFSHLTITIMQGAWAAGTSAVTLAQATTVAAGGTKALGFTKRWTKVALTGTTYTETAVASNTFNLPNVANTINVLEIDAADLDVDGGFDCVMVNCATPGANADLIAIHYLLTGARYPQATAVDPKVD
jgi:hypothetical protein